MKSSGLCKIKLNDDNVGDAKVFIAQAAAAAYNCYVFFFSCQKFSYLFSYGLYLPFCSQATVIEWVNYFQLATDSLRNEVNSLSCKC